MLKNKSIAVVFTADIVGGHELMAIEHVKKFLAKGFRISCYAPKDNEKLNNLLKINNIPYAPHSVKHNKMEIIHSFLNISQIMKAIFFLKKINAISDEIIIVQGDIELGSGFVNASKLVSIKVTSYIPYTHSFKKMGSKGGGIKDYLSKFVYSNCTHYITICDSFKKDLDKKNSRATVRVLKNFVPSPPPTQIRHVGYEFTNSTDTFRILMAGRIFFRQKGQDKLIKAVKELDLDMKIEIVVIGDGPDMPKLKNIAKGLPSNISVVFVGWIQTVWDYAYNVDVIVIPSNYEGVPLIMLEGMKRNIPIVAPARDGMKDYLGKESLYDVGEYSYECEKLKEKLFSFIIKR